jgi:hypothetical protein
MTTKSPARASSGPNTVSTSAAPDSTYTHSSPTASRYSGDGSPATAYEIRTSALASTSRRPVTTSVRFHSSPSNRSWSFRWRGSSGWFGVVAWSGSSHGLASTSAEGSPAW